MKKINCIVWSFLFVCIAFGNLSISYAASAGGHAPARQSALDLLESYTQKAIQAWPERNFQSNIHAGTSLIIGNHPQQELIDRYATPKERDRMYSFLITSALMKHASKQSLNLEEFFSDLKSYDKSKHEKIWKHQFISYFISLATEIYTNTENPLNNTDIFLTIINGGYRAYHAT